MKKIIIGAIIFLVIGGGFLYFIYRNSSSIQWFGENRDLGVIPPDGWYLWEGISANFNCEPEDYDPDYNPELDTFDNPYVPETSLLQDCLLNWSPKDLTSRTIIYTNSSVDLKTRDLQKIFEYANETIDYALSYNSIAIFLRDEEVGSIEEIENDRIKREYLEIYDNKAIYTRITAFDDFDIATIEVPYKDSKSIGLQRMVSKNLSDDEILKTFKSFSFK